MPCTRRVSVDIRKIYACLFRPLISTMRMFFRQNSLKALTKEPFIVAHCFDRPQVRPFHNSVFITERWAWFYFLQIFVNICISLQFLQIIVINQMTMIKTKFFSLSSILKTRLDEVCPNVFLALRNILNCRNTVASAERSSENWSWSKPSGLIWQIADYPH